MLKSFIRRASLGNLAALLVAITATSIAAQSGPAATSRPGASASRPAAADRTEFASRLAKLKKEDVAGHVELAKWGLSVGLDKEAQALLRKVIESSPNNEDARRLLGFVRKDGKWVNQAEQDAQAKAKADADAKKSGLVQFNGEWVPKEHLPFLQKGLVLHADEWVTKEEKEKLGSGWKRLDMELVPPDEAENIQKGLFKINGQWVSVDEANKYHSSDATPWVIPSRHFIVTSTIPRAEIERLTKRAELTYETLRGLLKTEPAGKIRITLFSNIDAANAYAQSAGAGDHSSVWPGYVSEADPERPTVALYESGFGHLYIAHAAAHKFLDEVAAEPDKIPDWFTEGLVVYAERYADVEVRDWSIKSLVGRGGFTHVADLTKSFKLSAEDAKASQTRLFEVGLIVAYLATNPDKGDGERFRAVIANLTKPADRERAIQNLIAQPSDLDKHILKFAGIEH